MEYQWKTYRLRPGLQWEHSRSTHRFETGEQRARLGAFGLILQEETFGVLFERFNEGDNGERVETRGRIRARPVSDWDIEECEVRLAGQSGHVITLPVKDFLILFEEDKSNTEG